MRIQEEKIGYSKRYMKEFVRGTSFFFGCTPSFLYHFLLPFSSAPSISSDLILRTKSFAPEKVPPLPPVSTTHSIKDFFSKCDQIHRKLRIWSHLLKKSLMENFIFLCCVMFDLTLVSPYNNSKILFFFNFIKITF